MTSKNTALMDSSRERKGIREGGWFSLFFWPAFRRIFLLNRKAEVWHQRPDPGPPPAADSSQKPNDDSSSPVPRILVETQLEHWVRWTLECNIALAAALKRIRDSYKLLQAGKPAEDADEILAEVEELLKAVEKSNM